MAFCTGKGRGPRSSLKFPSNSKQRRYHFLNYKQQYGGRMLLF
jgi:hypothetical protein